MNPPLEDKCLVIRLEEALRRARLKRLIFPALVPFYVYMFFSDWNGGWRLPWPFPWLALNIFGLVAILVCMLGLVLGTFNAHRTVGHCAEELRRLQTSAGTKPT